MINVQADRCIDVCRIFQEPRKRRVVGMVGRAERATIDLAESRAISRMGVGFHMGGCQNYGPLSGPLNTRCRIILRNNHPYSRGQGSWTDHLNSGGSGSSATYDAPDNLVTFRHLNNMLWGVVAVHRNPIPMTLRNMEAYRGASVETASLSRDLFRFPAGWRRFASAIANHG